jgi:predicted RNA binding protein YcfA (HicA-like mRNA interferase family)
MKVREIIRRIEAEGWILKDQAGSHRQYVHPVRPGKVTVPGHPGKDVAPGTLRSILRQAGIERGDL